MTTPNTMTILHWRTTRLDQFVSIHIHSISYKLQSNCPPNPRPLVKYRPSQMSTPVKPRPSVKSPRHHTTHYLYHKSTFYTTRPSTHQSSDTPTPAAAPALAPALLVLASSVIWVKMKWHLLSGEVTRRIFAAIWYGGKGDESGGGRRSQ